MKLDAARGAKAIEWASWGFALLGLTLPIALYSPPFALYRSALESGVGLAQGGLAEHAALVGLVSGITGGSIAGKWAMHAAIARFGLARRQRWARDATLVGLLCWFAIDSASSMLAGAWWNVAMVNAMPMLVVGLPLALAWRELGQDDTLPPPLAAMEQPARAVILSAGIGACSGLVIAFGGGSFAFAPWFDGLVASGIVPGALSDTHRALALSFFGPIGGCVSAQFAMIVLAARGPLRAGARSLR